MDYIRYRTLNQVKCFFQKEIPIGNMGIAKLQLGKYKKIFIQDPIPVNIMPQTGQVMESDFIFWAPAAKMHIVFNIRLRKPSFFRGTTTEK